MFVRALLALLLAPGLLVAADKPADTSAGDALVAEYFRLETDRIAEESARRVLELADPRIREARRQQLRDMLGLDPMPPRTPLEPVITGKLDHPEFTVEKLHFQSSPGLYVTGNLYVPKGLKGKAPTVLYVCGHSVQKKDGISFGNKAGYQHHGGWFARNGYVCLTIDTLQLGEIEGVHHGTYRENRWWWHSRGYTPAGVEAWNCIRALDYLETRPEVDMAKVGVTGRSGGGAYSWWILGIDDRIQAAVPVAGITSMHNHVVDGVIAGHCDCMFQTNTYEWDYTQLPALFAPKPLLISNTDKDRIFPLEGVVDVHARTRSVYRALKADDKLGLQITEGPHKDTQELHTHAFVWMNRFLKGQELPIEQTAVKFFQPEELRVFQELPKDQINTRIDELFIPMAAAPSLPKDLAEWNELKTRMLAGLRDRVFRGWPEEEPDAAAMPVQLASETREKGLHIARFNFLSQRPYRLPLWVVTHGDAAGNGPVTLVALDASSWPAFAEWLAKPSPTAETPWMGLISAPGSVVAFTAPRGVGPTEWTNEKKPQADIRRRFALLGQTDDGQRVWDVRCAIRAVREITKPRGRPLHLEAAGEAAVSVLYASLFEPPVAKIRLTCLTASHQGGPALLNVLRVLDVPVTVALAASNAPVSVAESGDVAAFAREAAKSLGNDVIRIEAK